MRILLTDIFKLDVAFVTPSSLLKIVLATLQLMRNENLQIYCSDRKADEIRIIRFVKLSVSIDFSFYGINNLEILPQEFTEKERYYKKRKVFRCFQTIAWKS